MGLSYVQTNTIAPAGTIAACSGATVQNAVAKLASLGGSAGDFAVTSTPRVKRASAIANVGFCKLKLKRFGGLDLLREALDAVHEWGMEAVLGDGLSCELGCWMEACVARVTIRNAGEFNGFLKPNVRLFSEPLQLLAGELVLPSGFTPTIDADALARHETTCERFVPATAGWTARIN